MLKVRHRYRVTPHTRRANRVPHRSNIIPVEDVGIVPGSRFILLPLKRVSTIVRSHRCCRSSATSTKTCIVQKATIVSQPALFQTVLPTERRVVSTGDVLGENRLKKVLRSGSVRSSNRLIRRASLKHRHAHPAIVKTCLSPVSEQEQEAHNSFVGGFLLEQGNWNQESRKPLDSRKGSLYNANDKDFSDSGQFYCERVENEQNNEVMSRADKQPTSMSRVHGSSLWSEDGVHKQREASLGQEENGRRLDADNVVSNTRNYEIFVGTPDSWSISPEGGTDRICDDDSVLRPSPSLQETQHTYLSLQSHCGIPRAATTINYLSLVLMESETNSSRLMRLSQQSSQASSGSFLGPVLASSVNVINCIRAVERSTETSSSKDLTIVEAQLGQHSEHLQERDGLNQKDLELGTKQGVLLNRKCRHPGDSQRDSSLPALDLFVTRNQSFNDLVDEMPKGPSKTQCNTERDHSAIRNNQERIRRAAALKQENVLRGEQRTVNAHHQRGANKKLRKVVPKIHTFGRNRVSLSCGSVGHKAFEVRTIGQQFLLPPQMPEIVVKGVGEFSKYQNRRSRRFGNWNEDFYGDQSSAVSCGDVQKRTYLKRFLCSFASSDDLPIGPLSPHY